MGGPLARDRRRHRHRARERGRPGDHPRRPRERGVRRPRDRAASTPIASRSSRGRSPRRSASPASPPTRSASSRTPTRRAERAQLCWTLGITEHHNGVDNVFALINLALLTGHVGRYGSGLAAAARPEQRPGRRRHGRAPEQAARLRRRRGRRGARPLRGGVGRRDPADATGCHLTEHVRGDGARRPARALRDRREPGPVGGRPGPHAPPPRRASTTSSSRTSS